MNCSEQATLWKDHSSLSAHKNLGHMVGDISKAEQADGGDDLVATYWQ